jgi:signal transduction histidine kinase
MRHRIAGLGGVWDVRTPSKGGTVVTAVIPLDRMLMPEAEGEEPALASVPALKKFKF